jgi:large subunit ribosomal protein L22
MHVRALARNIRMSPRKAGLVVEAIRGRPVPEALALLEFMTKGAARPVAKVLKSAAANAENNYQLVPEDLYVVAAFADKGPVMRRYRARARGRAGLIRRPMTHITVVVGEKGA